MEISIKATLDHETDINIEATRSIDTIWDFLDMFKDVADTMGFSTEYEYKVFLDGSELEDTLIGLYKTNTYGGTNVY